MYNVFKNIIASITILAALAYFVYSLFSNKHSLYEYMILSLLILISTTFILETLNEKNKWHEINKGIENIVQNIVECKISTFDDIDMLVNALDQILRDGKHSVDIAGLDTSARNKVKNKHDRIREYINNLCSNPNIKFRYITSARKNNYEYFLDRIISGSSKQDSYLAYYCLPPKFSFASFWIIDNRYISTRSPFSEGEIHKYIIIENKEIVEYYKSWFKFLWNDSNKIVSIKCLDELYQKFCDEFTDDEKKSINKKLKQINNIRIMNDI
jgi:hypothetical protein